jgi:hypothetical protein
LVANGFLAHAALPKPKWPSNSTTT